MIKKPQNWENVQEFAEWTKLPLGAYVCKVKQVAVQNTAAGNVLAVLFDIVEGEYKEYFAKDFSANQNANKKWRGVLRQWLPKDDGSDNDEMTKRSFKGMVTSFERSNPGYQWNWDEASLVGKTVGIMFRNEEWEYNGKNGWSVKPFRAMSADTVRSGDYTLPQDKPLANKAQSSAPAFNQSAFTPVETDDLPF